MTTSVGNIIPNSTVPGTGWPRHYADSCIDESTIYCYDFSNPESWPSQAASTAGQSVLNLVGGGAAGVVSSVLPFSNGGLNFTVAEGERIALPAAAKLASGNDFMWNLTLTRGSQTQATPEVGGYHYNDTGPYGVRHVSAGSMRMLCSGKNYDISTGGLMFLHMAMEQVDVSTWMAHFLKNGVLLSSQLITTPMQQPSTAVANAGLGDVTGTNYFGYWVGKIHRSWLTTKHRTQAQIVEKALEDYDLNNGYFA